MHTARIRIVIIVTHALTRRRLIESCHASFISNTRIVQSPHRFPNVMCISAALCHLKRVVLLALALHFTAAGLRCGRGHELTFKSQAKITLTEPTLPFRRSFYVSAVHVPFHEESNIRIRIHDKLAV